MAIATFPESAGMDSIADDTLELPWPTPQLRLVAASDEDGGPFDLALSERSEPGLATITSLGDDADAQAWAWVHSAAAAEVTWESDPSAPLAIGPFEVVKPVLDPNRRGCEVKARHSVVARRRAAPSGKVLRRRLALGVVVSALLVVLSLPLSAVGGRAVSGVGATSPSPSGAHSVAYVVQPGDTLTSIAERVDPGSDPRAVAAQLAAVTGSATVVPGEHIVLPADKG
jgi:hypothetical protein